MSLVMYSTNSRLAFMINQKYYGQLHYVYCCPYFDPRSVNDLEHNTPPSSSPCELFRDFAGEASRNDKHPKSIEVNKAGLHRGAVAKLDGGVITPDQHRDILEIIAGAGAVEFRPLLYVIPFEVVATKIRAVPLEKKAHPFSEEYIIDELNRTEFDCRRIQGIAMFEVLKSKDVSSEDAFTAAYSAIRILQYRSRLRPTGYVRFLRGHKTTISTGRLKLALQLLAEIERHEKVKVTDLDARVARKYELALASAVNKRAKIGVDLRRSKALIAQLEKETVSSR